MKHLTLFVAAVMALVVAGCAGSGGGDNGGNNPPDETLGTPRIEAVVRVERTNLIDPTKYTDDELQDPQVVSQADLIVPTVYGVQDISNFQTNESYYFQLVAYSDSGRRVILPASFTTEDSEFTYGVVGNSGLYLASGTPTSEPVSVYADYNGARYSSTYQVFERRVRAIGHVYAEGSNAPLDGITVEFFNADGTFVAKAISGYDGSFRASVPLTATFMSLNSQLLPNTYYRSYVVNGLRYDAGDADCRTPVSFTQTGAVSVDPIYVTPRVAGQPTPNADGCTDGGGDE